MFDENSLQEIQEMYEFPALFEEFSHHFEDDEIGCEEIRMLRSIVAFVLKHKDKFLAADGNALASFIGREIDKKDDKELKNYWFHHHKKGLVSEIYHLETLYARMIPHLSRMYVSQSISRNEMARE